MSNIYITGTKKPVINELADQAVSTLLISSEESQPGYTVIKGVVERY
jgi:hypothetical protein